MNQATTRRFLAIDYGRRRIGLAKSDELGIIASAYKTIEVSSKKQGFTQVTEVIQEIDPDALIIGYPLLRSGDKSEMCLEIDEFITRLAEVYSGPIHRVDEYGSSGDAMRIIHSHGKKSGKRKPVIDRLAAVVILQRFLDEGAAR